MRLVRVTLPLLAGAWNPLLRADPDVKEGNRLLGEGRPADARKAYDRAAKRLPDEPAVRLDRGTALVAEGKTDEGLAELAAAAASPEHRALAWYNAGNALVRAGRLKEAVDAYRHALRAAPEDPRPRWNLEVAMRRRKEEPPPQQQQERRDPKQQEGARPDERQDKGGAPKEPEDSARAGESQGAAEGTRAPGEIETILQAVEGQQRSLAAERLRSTRRRRVEKDW